MSHLRLSSSDGGLPDGIDVRGFIEREHGRLCRLIAVQINKLAGSHRVSELWEQANEVLQETAVQALQSVERFEAGRAVLPWLMGIAINVIRNRFRRLRRDARVRPASALTDDESGAVLERAAPEPAFETEDRAALQAALVRLSPQAREAIEQRYFKGLDGEELARALGTNRVAARVRVCRALRDLRTHLCETGEQSHEPA